MASYNIEVNIQSHKVDRSYPAILNGHYSESQFNLFCDKVDAIIGENIDTYKRYRMIHYCIQFGTFAILALFMILYFRYDPFTANNKTHDIIIPAIFVPFIVINVGGILWYSKKMSQMAQDINSKVRTVCEQASRDSSSFVSFHLREPKVVGYTPYTSTSNTSEKSRRAIYSQGHIEVIVANGGATTETTFNGNPLGTSTNPYSEHASMMGAASTAGSSSSPAVRLAQLDTMKNMMSDEEYEKKREEIISSV